MSVSTSAAASVRWCQWPRRVYVKREGWKRDEKSPSAWHAHTTGNPDRMFCGAQPPDDRGLLMFSDRTARGVGKVCPSCAMVAHSLGAKV